MEPPLGPALAGLSPVSIALPKLDETCYSSPLTANALLHSSAPPQPPLGPCSLQMGQFSLVWSCAQWLGLAVGASDLLPSSCWGEALLLVQFSGDSKFRFYLTLLWFCGPPRPPLVLFEF